VSPGDKIIIDFGKGLLTITKVYYKNGRVTQLSPEEIEEELSSTRNVLSNVFFAKDDLYIYHDNLIDIDRKKDTEDDLYEMVDGYFNGIDIPKVTEKNKEEEIDFVEVIVNYSCYLMANRLVQVCKKSTICLFRKI
jgi:hypothetical protein